MLTTILTHAIALVVGLGGGWIGHKKLGAKADAVVLDVQKTVADAKK